MSEPFLSEIKIISWNYAPKGWAFCNGQLLPINQNQALFSLLGTTYGGNGQTTFALPDLRGKIPIHFGSGFILGQTGGAESHTLTQSRDADAHPYPQRRRAANGTQAIPVGNLLGARATKLYAPADESGRDERRLGDQPRAAARRTTNMQPYLDAEFCHRPPGHLPVAELRRRIHGQSLCRRDSDVRAAASRPPAGCSATGQLLPISENETLFNLIGTTYGGDGESTFAAAQSAEPRADARGQRSTSLGRDRRRRGGHADRRSRFRSTASAPARDGAATEPNRRTI